MPFDDDARLVARICAGEEKAIEEFSTSYRQFAFAILTRHLNLRSEDADEIFQRFLFHIWENDFQRLRRWSGKTALAAYLAKILRNLAHDYRRQLRFESNEIMDIPIDDSQMIRVENKAMIESALRRMSGEDRALIYRRFYLEQSYSDIASATNSSENRVGVALSRAKHRLRKILSEEF